jgi:hypothetical protein
LLEFGYLRLGGFESSVSESVEKGFSNPLLLGLYGNLFSLGRSVFLYSPPTILLLFAFREFYRRQRAEALLFVSIIAIYFLVYSSFGDWHGGWAWGPRYLLPMLPFMIIPVGYFLEGGAKLAIAAAITAAGVFVQVLGLGVSYGNVYWDWVKMGLYPDSAFLFVPEISPIPTHFNNLIDGRYVDLWLVWVYRTFGAEVLAWTASVLLFVLGISVFLLRGMGPRLRSGVRSRRGHELPGRGPVILSGAKNLEAFAIRRFRSFANAQDDRGRKQSGRKRSG